MRNQDNTIQITFGVDVTDGGICFPQINTQAGTFNIYNKENNAALADFLDQFADFLTQYREAKQKQHANGQPKQKGLWYSADAFQQRYGIDWS